MIPLAAQLAIAAAPSVIGLVGGRFMKSKASPYEREMQRLSGFFKNQSELPYQQTQEGAAEMGMLNAADEQARRRNQNLGTASGSTAEAQVAAMGEQNKSYASGLRGVMSNAGDHRRRSLAAYMGALDAAEQARQQREADEAARLGNLTQAAGAIGSTVLMADMMRGPVAGKVPPAGTGTGTTVAPAAIGFNAKNMGTRRLSSVFGAPAVTTANYAAPSLVNHFNPWEN